MTIRFDTKRDFEALSQLIKQSALGLHSPDVVDVDVISGDDETQCDHTWADSAFETNDCDRIADVRIVRHRSYERGEGPIGREQPPGVYSDTYCLDCLRVELDAWIETQLEAIRKGIRESRAEPTDTTTEPVNADD